MRARYLVVLTATAMTALTGCEVYHVSGELDRATLDLTFTVDGGTYARLELGGPPSRDRLLEVGEAVAPALLPTAEHRTVSVAENGPLDRGSDEYVEIGATNTYQPGTQSVAAVDTDDAVSVLRAQGYRIIDVFIGVPAMPAVAEWQPTPDTATDDSWIWKDIDVRDPAPAGSVRLQPEPWNGMPSLAMFAVSLVCVVVAAVALHRRRRIVAAVGAGLFCVPLVAGYELIDDSDHLPATGVLEQAARGIAAVAPFAAMLIVAGAIYVFAVAIGGHRFQKPPLVFNPPPGWPAAPPGWRPYAGWRPDPAWPSAPDGWEFFVERRPDP